MALATSSGDAWSRFAQKIKALSMNFPETRFSDQENSKKVRGTGQESCHFDHLDELVRIRLRPQNLHEAPNWLLIKIRTANDNSFHEVSRNQMFKPGNFQESSWNWSRKSHFLSSWYIDKMHPRDLHEAPGRILIKIRNGNERSSFKCKKIH